MPNARVISGRHQVYVEGDDGLKWIVENGSHNDAMGIGHEMDPAGRSIHDYIMGSIPAGGVFLDVGAHVGHYTVRASRTCEHVYAVEANPQTAARLLANLELNGCRNVTVVAAAAWDSWQFLALGQEGEPVRGGGMRTVPGEGPVMVAAMPLGGLLCRLDRLDVVKMDIEGAELHALPGMSVSLERLRPRIIIEDHSWNGYFPAGELRAREASLQGYRWADAASLGVEGPILNYRIGEPDGDR